MVTLVVVAERSVITVSGQAVALFFLARARWRLAVSLSTAERVFEKVRLARVG